jgi:hypothetical protein
MIENKLNDMKKEPPIMHFYQDGLTIYIWNKKGNHEKYWVHEPREAIMKFKKKYGVHSKIKNRTGVPWDYFW